MLSSVFLKKKRYYCANTSRWGMESIQLFCSFQQPALTADWEFQMHIQVLLSWTLSLCTVLWCSSINSSTKIPDHQVGRLDGWGRRSRVRNHPELLHRTPCAGAVLKEPWRVQGSPVQASTTPVLWTLQFLRTWSQGNSKDQKASKRLAAKKMGHIF